MSLENVLARSRKRTRLTERKRFTVAADKAFEKQKLFAMQSSEDWVLRAFQCASFSGAELVGMDTRPTQITIGWVGGHPVHPDQLDDVFSYLLTDRADPATRHLAQLALALTGALARKPVELRVESVGPGGATCMLIDDRGVARVGDPGPGLDGTYITVVTGRSWFRRFHAVTHSNAADHLYGHTQFADTPLLVNPCTSMEYSRFPFHDPDAPVRGARDGRKWALHPNRFRNRDRVDVVVGGITIQRLEIPGLGMRGVVWDDRLRLSADQSKVAQGPRWNALVHVVVSRAHRWLKAEGRDVPVVDLPPLADEGEFQPADDPVIVAIPLPDFLRQVPPRQPLARPVGRTKPLFYVWPDDVDAMIVPLDPSTLPVQVAILSEGEAETLRREGVSVHRLTAGAGVAFVRRMAVAEEVLQTSARSIGKMDLVMTLHPGDGAPPWALVGAPLPMSVQYKGSTTYVGGVGLDLPGCSVKATGSSHVGEVQAAILQHGLGLSLPLASHDSEEGRRLLRHLVQRLGVPRLFENEDGLGLDVILPRELELAREVPLIAGKSLDQVLSVAGTDQVIQVDNSDDYAALEAWLGVGHFVDGRVEGGSLAGVGFDGERWIAMKGVGTTDICQFLAVLPTFKPPATPEGWQRLDVPLPLFGLYHKQQAPWQDGARRLVAQLPVAALQSTRLQALLPLATVQLSRLCGVSGPALSPYGSDVRVVAAGGLSSEAPDVLPVSLDLLRALAPDVRLPVRLDDAPDVWRAPDEHDWVVRMPVDVAGIDGWLGLRRPFDSSGAVLLTRPDGGMDLLDAFDERFPCHGILRATGDVSQGNLLLPGMQLYRVLEAHLRRRPDDQDALAYVECRESFDLERPSERGSDAWTARLQAVADAACGSPMTILGSRRQGRFAVLVGLHETEARVQLTGGDQVFAEVRAVEVLLVEAVRCLAAEAHANGIDFDLLGGLEVLAAGR